MQTPKLNPESAWEMAQKSQSRAMLVLQQGKILFERYAPGWNERLRSPLASGSKSFCGVLAVCAVHDGLFRSLDEPLHETVPEWRDDPKARKITLRHLLSLESGMDPGVIGRNEWLPYEEALKTPIRHEPGTRFAYGPNPFLAFGAILTRKLKTETVESYLNRRILKPLGIQVEWRRTRAGEIALPGGAWATARDWATFGQFVLAKGTWQGKQIVPAQLMDECFRPSQANKAYGLTFWLYPNAPMRTHQTPPLKDFAMAAGMGGQRLYLFFKWQLAIVRLGPVRGANNFRDLPFLNALLGEEWQNPRVNPFKDA